MGLAFIGAALAVVLVVGDNDRCTKFGRAQQLGGSTVRSAECGQEQPDGERGGWYRRVGTASGHVGVGSRALSALTGPWEASWSWQPGAPLSCSLRLGPSHRHGLFVGRVKRRRESSENFRRRIFGVFFGRFGGSFFDSCVRARELYVRGPGLCLALPVRALQTARHGAVWIHMYELVHVRFSMPALASHRAEVFLVLSVRAQASRTRLNDAMGP